MSQQKMKAIEKALMDMDALLDKLTAKIDLLEKVKTEFGVFRMGNKTIKDQIKEVAHLAAERFRENFYVREYDEDINLDKLKREDMSQFEAYVAKRIASYEQEIETYLVNTIGTHPIVNTQGSLYATAYSLFGSPNKIFDSLIQQAQAQFRSIFDEKVQKNMQLEMLRMKTEQAEAVTPVSVRYEPCQYDSVKRYSQTQPSSQKTVSRF